MSQTATSNKDKLTGLNWVVAGVLVFFAVLAFMRWVYPNLATDSEIDPLDETRTIQVCQNAAIPVDRSDWIFNKFPYPPNAGTYEISMQDEDGVMSLHIELVSNDSRSCYEDKPVN